MSGAVAIAGRIAGALLTPVRLTPVGAGISLALLAYGAYDTYRNNTGSSPRIPEATPQPVPTTPAAPTNPRQDPGAKVGEGRYTSPSVPLTPEQIQKALAGRASEAVGGANPAAGSGADSGAGAGAGTGVGASNANDLLQALKDIANNGTAASSSLALISGALLNFPKLIEAIKASAPTITIPDIAIPEIKVPEIDFAPVAAAIKALEFPKVEIPAINVPPVSIPELPAALS